MIVYKIVLAYLNWTTLLTCTHCVDETLDNRALCSAGKRVLELGAGTGLCGLICRRFTAAAHVTVTDVASALPLIRSNWRLIRDSVSSDVENILTPLQVLVLICVCVCTLFLTIQIGRINNR
jgi:predicted nicotinamide N-methyase